MSGLCDLRGTVRAWYNVHGPEFVGFASVRASVSLFCPRPLSRARAFFFYRPLIADKRKAAFLLPVLHFGGERPARQGGAGPSLFKVFKVFKILRVFLTSEKRRNYWPAGFGAAQFIASSARFIASSARFIASQFSSLCGLRIISTPAGFPFAKYSLKSSINPVFL